MWRQEENMFETQTKNKQKYTGKKNLLVLLMTEVLVLSLRISIFHILEAITEFLLHYICSIALVTSYLFWGSNSRPG